MNATDTSAAARIEPPAAMMLRERCMGIFKERDCTADEVATLLSASILAIRPRISELRSLGVIRDSLKRRPNDSGHKAIVWEIVPITEPELFV